MPLYTSQVHYCRFFVPLWFTLLQLIFLFQSKNIEMPKKSLGIYIFQINKSTKTLVILFFIIYKHNLVYSWFSLGCCCIFTVSLEYISYYSHISLAIYIPSTLEIKIFIEIPSDKIFPTRHIFTQVALGE